MLAARQLPANFSLRFDVNVSKNKPSNSCVWNSKSDSSQFSRINEYVDLRMKTGVLSLCKQLLSLNECSYFEMIFVCMDTTGWYGFDLEIS